MNRLLAIVAVLTVGICATAARAEPLIEINPAALDAAQKTGVRCSIQKSDGAQAIHIESGGTETAEVTFAPAQGVWDLSMRESIVIDVRNPGTVPVTARARVENADAQGLMNTCRGAVVLMPGERRELVVPVTRRPEDPGYDVFKPFYMYVKNINVRDNTVDPAHLVKLMIAIDKPKAGAAIDVSSIRPAGERDASKPVSFFPFVDGYGQYIHAEWPAKIDSDQDFAARRAEESKDRADRPGPKDWDKYGGWTDGPTLKATGFFYPTKHDGKWWLVDPDGRLFWSYGPTGVGFGGDLSPITDRENWFSDLPPRDSPLGKFYRNGKGALYRYYQNREWLGFDVQRANLVRKYGDGYENDVANLSHDRLRSWGFNSFGNWSDSKIYLMRRTPYVVAIHYDAPTMIHVRMPDVYHPDWETSVKQRMERERERDRTANDAWNIGYFIDNERWWGWRPRAAAVGEETLKNPPDRHAKVRFVELLKTKYPSIDALNDAWGTKHESWQALLESKAAPDMKNEKILADCGDFGMMFAERYFTVCRDAVKSVAPNNMYLGPRFNGHIDPELVKLASKYCDVISYNIYDNPPEKRVNQYVKLDVPIMSTEWGIGSDPQQTPFRGDNLKVPTPAERAREMASYAEHAIRHPSLVGAHFFQFRDQPLSGRPDGEATLRGFVNIADTPSFELIQANRAVGYDLYKTRAAAK
jgi:hypothetical protein